MSYIYQKKYSNLVKILVSLLIASVLLVGCSKNPSDLTCSVWNEKKAEAGKLVDYWADLSSKRELTLDEKRQAWNDQDYFIEILNEMENVGCPTE